MNANKLPDNPQDPADALYRGTGLLRDHGLDPSGRWLLVDVYRQCLDLVVDGAVHGTWPVSTAATGLDNRQDSGGTPPGLHTIDRKIGQEAEPGMIFASRRSTGILWRKTAAGSGDELDLILTRILTLAGCEEGVNRGPQVDSRERYIYIHGTNHEETLGTPASHGCIRMASSAVTDLFERVQEGDPVVII